MIELGLLLALAVVFLVLWIWDRRHTSEWHDDPWAHDLKRRWVAGQWERRPATMEEAEERFSSEAW